MYLEAITKPSWTIGVELAWGRTPTEVPCVNGKKRQVAIDTRNKLRETTWSRSRALPEHRRTPDWMVMTEGMTVNLTLQLTRREN